jgi:hypothetical protein
MPAHHAPREREGPAVVGRFGDNVATPERVDGGRLHHSQHRVVKVQQVQVQLGDDRILVVPRVADDRDVDLVAREVHAVGTDEQNAGATGRVVQFWAAVRAIPVDVVEVQCGSAGLRTLTIVSGSTAMSESRVVVSNVIVWSTNWPKKTNPAGTAASPAGVSNASFICAESASSCASDAIGTAVGGKYRPNVLRR